MILSEFQASEIVSVGDFVSERRDVLSVLWAIVKGCNYKCSYCSYSKDVGFSTFSSREDLLAAARRIVRLGRPGYQITLYGGEPTFHPHFQDLLEYLASVDAKVSLRVFTNGSRPAHYFENLIATMKSVSFGIIFSLHLDWVKFDNFKRCVEVVAGAGIATTVNFMFIASERENAHRYMDELLELRARIPFFLEINHPYDLDGVMAGRCTAQDLEWVQACRDIVDKAPMPSDVVSPSFARVMSTVTLERQGARQALPPEESLRFLTRLHTPSYTDFYCCSGSNVLFVEEDGWARGGVCDRSRRVGNVFHDSEVELIQGMGVVRCGAAACSSIENIPLPKFRSAAEAEACVVDFKDRAKAAFYRAEASRLGVASSAE